MFGVPTNLLYFLCIFYANFYVICPRFYQFKKKMLFRVEYTVAKLVSLRKSTV